MNNREPGTLVYTCLQFTSLWPCSVEIFDEILLLLLQLLLLLLLLPLLLLLMLLIIIIIK